MDIVFKIGEHYYEGGFDSPLINLLLTVLGSLLGFWTALYFDRKARRADAKKGTRKTERRKDKGR